jgi:EAL domain-containing protein (putative c-di-GMP-specific phosphodiesterase class I)
VLDDFGVGYSTLAQIGRLPVKRLKIDRAFVAGVPLERASAAVVEVVIGLARALDLRVTAEGVETEAQRAWLALAGVDSAQGYLIAKPLEAAEAAAWLARQKADHEGLAA